jgi:hypothetical protein
VHVSKTKGVSVIEEAPPEDETVLIAYDTSNVMVAMAEQLLLKTLSPSIYEESLAEESEVIMVLGGSDE